MWRSLGVWSQKKGNGADTYLHRAGRFGTKGLAITFVASKEDSEVLNQVGVAGLCVFPLDVI